MSADVVAPAPDPSPIPAPAPGPAPTRAATRRPRLDAVDVARSIAIFGMFTAHLGGRSFENGKFDPSILGFSEGRSAALFMILAGVGTALLAKLDQHDYSQGLPRMLRAFPFFGIRAAYLWGISLVLIKTSFPVYVILGTYALVFLTAPIYIHLFKPWMSFAAAGVLAVVGWELIRLLPLEGDLIYAMMGGMPMTTAFSNTLVGGAYPLLVYSAYFLVGFGCAQLNLGKLRTRVGMVIGGATGFGAALIAERIVENYPLNMEEAAMTGVPVKNVTINQFLSFEPHSHSLTEIVGNIGFGVLLIGGLLLIWNDGKGGWRHIFAPFVAAGRMPLTLYTAHILIGSWISPDGTIIWNDSSMDLLAFIGGSLAFAWVWTRFIGRGPLEAIMRWISDWIRPRSTTAVAPVSSEPALEPEASYILAPASEAPVAPLAPDTSVTTEEKP